MRFGLPTLALLLGLTGGQASAQQQPTPTPGKIYPMSTAAYDVYVQRALARMRALRPVGPVTQADINLGVLLYRDCTSTIEADGVVTEGEHNYCAKVLQDFMTQKMHEIMLSSTPDQWRQWMQQATAANRH